jgi:outer membrane protein assembly factor BamB
VSGFATEVDFSPPDYRLRLRTRLLYTLAWPSVEGDRVIVDRGGAVSGELVYCVECGRGGREPTSIPCYGELSLAPQGVLQTDSYGTSPPAVLSSDGNVVIGLLAYSGTSAPSPELAADSLPDGRELWHGPRPNSVYLYGDAGGRVVVSEQRGEDTKLVALNDHTGAVDWQL